MDFSAIVGPALTTVGPWGLLILVVASVLTAFIKGALVSSGRVDRQVEALTSQHTSQLVELRAIWEARLNEGRQREQDWRAAFERSEDRADLLAGQVEQLGVYARTADQLLRALPRGDG